MKTRIRNGCLTILATLALAVAGCAVETSDEATSSAELAASADYTAAGPSEVTVDELTIAGRDVRAFVPQKATPAGGFGAVVFAHGFQLGRSDYDLLLRHVASWGYVVLSVDYASAFIGMDHRDVRDALTDVGAALGKGDVAGLPPIDGKRIAVAGHSIGGKAAVMAALDAPFRALLALDPVDGAPGNPLGGEGSAELPLLVPGAVANLTTPSLFVGAELSHCKKKILIFKSQACAPDDRDAHTFYDAATSSAARYDVTLADFGHIDFLDRSVGGMTRDFCVHAQHNRGTRQKALGAIAVAFLSRQLDGVAAAQTWLTGAKHAKLVAAGALVDPAAPPRDCP